MTEARRHALLTALALALALLLGIGAGRSFLAQRQPNPLYPSPALTRSFMLSEVNPGLEGTRSDTEVFVFEGARDGASLLVLGGTHPNEMAAFLAAVVMLENLQVQAGRVFLIPRANESAATHTEPQEASPRQVAIPTPGGQRIFRHGSRITNPVDQWPDPEIYLHPSSGSILAGNETRNLNRAYPGLADGTPTQRIAWAITELIRRESIDLAVDLHEAAPEYPVVNALVASERSQDVASFATFALEMEGLEFSLEPSPQNFRGLSHREWTDFTETLPFLLESANPAQGRLRGRTDAALVLEGKDRSYEKAALIGVLACPFDENGIPASLRVARHLEGIKAIVDAYNTLNPDRELVMGGVPGQEEILARGIGAFLHSP